MRKIRVRRISEHFRVGDRVRSRVKVGAPEIDRDKSVGEIVRINGQYIWVKFPFEDQFSFQFYPGEIEKVE